MSIETIITENIELPNENIEFLFNYIFLEIEDYNYEELKNELYLMKNISDNVITDFSDILINLTNLLANLNINTKLSMYKKDIINTLNNEPKKVIDTFIKHAYIHKLRKDTFRKELIIGNDSFFMKGTYEDYADNNHNIIDLLFEFKSFWNKLTKENINIIKSYFLTLISFSDKRFIIFYRYLEIKKKYQNKYKDLFKFYDNNI
jgi:hypothetical protein